MTRAKIDELMKLTGWSQRELARRMALTEAAVSRWRNEERLPAGTAQLVLQWWLQLARDGEDIPDLTLVRKGRRARAAS